MEARWTSTSSSLPKIVAKITGYLNFYEQLKCLRESCIYWLVMQSTVSVTRMIEFISRNDIIIIYSINKFTLPHELLNTAMYGEWAILFLLFVVVVVFFY